MGLMVVLLWEQSFMRSFMLLVRIASNLFNILYFFCLGANHEHNREDRDEYISIDKSKVSPEKLKIDYTKADGSFNGRGSPYDFKSLMQYPSFIDDSAIGEPLLPKIVLE